MPGFLPVAKIVGYEFHAIAIWVRVVHGKRGAVVGRKKRAYFDHIT